MFDSVHYTCGVPGTEFAMNLSIRVSGHVTEIKNRVFLLVYGYGLRSRLLQGRICAEDTSDEGTL